MLDSPQPSLTLTPSNPNPKITSLLIQTRSLIQQVDDHLRGSAAGKQNKNTNNLSNNNQEGLQLKSKGDIAKGVEDMLLLLESIISHNKQSSLSQIQFSPQLLPNLNALTKIKLDISRISNHLNKEKSVKGSFAKECKELTAILQNLLEEGEWKREEACEAESKGFESSKDSKRSLLTQKIKQAQLQQQQSQQILKTIRMNPKHISGNLIEQTKIRDRTVPIKLLHLQSQHQEKFSFSEPDSLQIQPQPAPHSRSSRILTEMHYHLAPREKRSKLQGLGCSRCQIY